MRNDKCRLVCDAVICEDCSDSENKESHLCLWHADEMEKRKINDAQKF